MAKVIKKEHLPKGRVYDVTVSGTHCFFATSKLGSQPNLVLAHNCHRMSKDAQDVLLKPLEERKLLGIFCTTEPEKVRGAIRSRCEEYHIRKVTREDILVRMQGILKAEGVEFEDEAVLITIDACGGHVRDVVNKLEMIAQTGSVTVSDAREYLNLSVVSIYYEVLLRIPTDTKGALALLDKICERITPEEAAAGLAESAMNAFRLANGMPADFTFTDKAMSQQVSSLYGPQLIRVAEFFLRSRYVTQIGLICDVVSLAQQLGSGQSVSAPKPAPRIAFQPVIVQDPSQAPEPASEPTPEVPETVSPGPDPTPNSEPTQAPSNPEPVQALVEPTPSKPTVIPPKGPIGNLGSSDTCAHTEFDTYVIDPTAPTKRRDVKVNFNTRSVDGRNLVPASIWRKDFEDLWRRKGSFDAN